MKYTVTGVKVTPIAKKDGMGTWNKIQVKTVETGDQILDLGFSVSKSVRDSIKIGTVITGYVESKPWTTSNGKSGVNLTLEGITAEYVYNLLLKLNPNLEGAAVKTAAPANLAGDATGSFGPAPTAMPTIDYPSDDINPDDIPF